MPLLVRLMFLFVLGRPLYQNNAQLLVAVRREKQVRMTMLVQAALLIVLCPPAVYFWGPAGASLAVSVMMVSGFVLSQVYVSRFLEAGFNSVYFLPGVLTIILSPLLYALGPLVGGGVFVTLIVKGVLATVLFAGVTFLFEHDQIGGVLNLILANSRLGRRFLPPDGGQ